MTKIANRLASLSPEQQLALLNQLRPGRLPSATNTKPSRAPSHRRYRPGHDPNFRVRLGTPGVLSTLHFEIAERKPVAPGQVEVEVHAAGVNFRDIALALGLYPLQSDAPPPALGWDYAGVVTGVGRGIERFKIGDEVLGMADQVDGCYRQYLTAEETWLLRKPSHWSFEEAASTLAVLVTAYFSLVEVGRLSRDERVLIHSAAGGVGLAAVKIAQSIGAEIFATGGTDEKRAYLRSLGINHVMNSRSGEYVAEILHATRQEGVDVILNSLPGAAISAGMSLLRPGGRFLELGRKDIVENMPLGLGVFARATLFASINIAFGEERRKRVYNGVQTLIESGAFTPLPLRVFPLSAIADAYASMSNGRHIGKTVLSIKHVPIDVSTP